MHRPVHPLIGHDERWRALEATVRTQQSNLCLAMQDSVPSAPSPLPPLPPPRAAPAVTGVHVVEEMGFDAEVAAATAESSSSGNGRGEVLPTPPPVVSEGKENSGNSFAFPPTPDSQKAAAAAGQSQEQQQSATRHYPLRNRSAGKSTPHRSSLTPSSDQLSATAAELLSAAKQAGNTPLAATASMGGFLSAGSDHVNHSARSTRSTRSSMRRSRG